MTWDEAVNQHVNMWKAKEANVPRGMISVCTYDDYEIKCRKPKSYSPPNRNDCQSKEALI